MKLRWDKLKNGFTLIELLIVVLIIAILAAIAVPNFLEFQTRAKVSRVVSDMRTIALAVEAYTVDNNVFPASPCDAPFGNGFSDADYIDTIYAQVTTPISYLSTFPKDPFAEFVPASTSLASQYDYRRGYETGFGIGSLTFEEILTGSGCAPAKDATVKEKVWILWSTGPDAEQEFNTLGFQNPYNTWAYYDPTNGTVSVGDIGRTSFATENSQIFNR